MIRSYSFLLFRMNGNRGKHFQNRQLETSFYEENFGVGTCDLPRKSVRETYSGP